MDPIISDHPQNLLVEKKNMKWSAFSSIEAAPNVTVTSLDGKDMEQMRTHGYPKGTLEIPRRYSLSIKREQNCSKRKPHNHTIETCLPTTPDEPPLTLTSTTPTTSLILPLTKKKNPNSYLNYPLDLQPLDPSPLKPEEPKPPLDHAPSTNNTWLS